MQDTSMNSQFNGNNAGTQAGGSPNIEFLARLLQQQNMQQSLNRKPMESLGNFGLLNQQQSPQQDVGSLLSRLQQNDNRLFSGSGGNNGGGGLNLMNLLNQNRPRMNQGSNGLNLASLLSSIPGNSGNGGMWNDNSNNGLNQLRGGKSRIRRSAKCYKCK